MFYTFFNDDTIFKYYFTTALNILFMQHHLIRTDSKGLKINLNEFTIIFLIIKSRFAWLDLHNYIEYIVCVQL